MAPTSSAGCERAWPMCRAALPETFTSAVDEFVAKHKVPQLASLCRWCLRRLTANGSGVLA